MKTRMLLATILGLAGCGGSGSDNETPTPTPTPEPPPPPTITWTVQGQVDQLSGGTIDLLLLTGAGEDTRMTGFSSTIDEEGQFEVAIEEFQEGDLDPQSWVVLRAQGEGDQAHIAWASHIATLQEAMENSGEDLILNHDEQARVHLTPLTTAHYLMTGRFQQELNSVEQLDQLATHTDPEQAVTLAAYLDLTAQQQLLPMDEGQTLLTLFDLTMPYHSAQAQLEAMDGYGTEQWQEQVVPLITQSIEAQLERHGMPLAITPDAPQLFSPASQYGWLAEQATVLQLDEEGNGSLDETNTSKHLFPTTVSMMSSSGSTLTLENQKEDYWSGFMLRYALIDQRFGEDVEAVLWEHINNSASDQVVIHFRPLSESFSRLDLAPWVVHRSLTELEVEPALYDPPFDWQGTNPVALEEEIFYRVILSPQSEVPFEAVGNWALNLPIENEFGNISWFSQRLVTLTDDGNVLFEDGTPYGSYSAAEGVLSVQSLDGWQLTYTPLQGEAPLLNALQHAQRDEVEHRLVALMAQQVETDTPWGVELEQELPLVLASYPLAWIADRWQGELLNFDYLWTYRFLADGTFHYISDDQIDDLDVFVSGHASSSNIYSWSRDDSGKVQIERRWDYAEGVVYERHWWPLSVTPDGYQVILESETAYEDQDRDGVADTAEIYFAPRINFLRPMNLKDYPEAYQNSLIQGTLPVH